MVFDCIQIDLVSNQIPMNVPSYRYWTSRLVARVAPGPRGKQAVELASVPGRSVIGAHDHLKDM